MDNRYYLAAIDLRGRRCLVVGAGSVGLEKTEGLLAADASVVVVALDAIESIRDLADQGLVELHLRGYETSDLEGCFLAIAATSDAALNTRVYENAEARSMLVNVVDVPALCNFILPAIARMGPIALAVSTAGASPALAKRMKREIQERFGESYARLAELLNEVRDWAKQNLPTYEDRKLFFEGIVNGEPDPISLLDRGDEAEVRALIERAQRSATSS